MKQVTMLRERGDCTDTPLPLWKDLITGLVLSGYEVYGDEERVVFCLGCDDSVKDIIKED